MISERRLGRLESAACTSVSGPNRHQVNENALLVGATAKGRKGTSWASCGGWWLEPGERSGLCVPCHNRKTVQETHSPVTVRVEAPAPTRWVLR